MRSADMQYIVSATWPQAPRQQIRQHIPSKRLKKAKAKNIKSPKRVTVSLRGTALLVHKW
jgi:hypothetical protein